ncbi:substrate-binding periplasmic protein [Colwelliaceae bacterium 6441]
MTEHFPPYQILNTKGEVYGLSAEIIQAALTETPYQYKIQIFPWSRAFIMAKETKNTCIFLIARNEQREKHFQWVSSIMPTNDYFIGLADRDDLNIRTIEDAKKYNVAVLKDDRTHHKLLQLGFVENKNLYIINNAYSMLKLLTTRKEIDLILADKINVKYRALYNNIDPSLFKTYMKLNKKPIELYFACSLGTPKEVVTVLQNAIEKIKRNGLYAKIFAQWEQKTFNKKE